MFESRFCRSEWKARGLALLGCLVMTAGCGHREWHYVALRGVSVDLPAMRGAESTVQRAGMPDEPLEIFVGGDQTVLVAYQSHDNPERSFDEWGRAFVVVLDGLPAKGRVDVSPDNARLIYHEPHLPARRPYVGLDGYVNILSVDGSEVTTYCALRSRMRDAYDKTYVLRGFHTFETATGTEPFLQSGGLRLEGGTGGEPMMQGVN